MHIDRFDFPLPADAIARAPLVRGAEARLLVLHRATGAISHHRVGDLPGLLGPAFHVVANDSRVLPSTVEVPAETGDLVRVALSRDVADGRWRPAGRAEEVVDPTARPGLDGLPAGALAWAQMDPEEAARRLGASAEVTFPRYLAHLRELYPRGVPPFYHTAWARVPGSVAPSSAGLNVTAQVLGEILDHGATFSTLTAHIGHVTFRRPVVADLDDHTMEGERFALTAEQAGAVLDARAAGRRILAVGTSATRALEHLGRAGGIPRGGVDGVADLFIRPGHRFQAVDALLTGLHGPRTTLFMLVCAFGGRDAVLEAYREALERGYRWYTLGDSMLIL